MADMHFISTDALDALFAALAGDGRTILAPTERDGRTELNPVQQPAHVAQGYLQTILSAKETVFPRVEKLMGFTLGEGSVELQDAQPDATPRILFGIRPCEAAAFQALGAVFGEAPQDAFFQSRMQALAIIAVSCTQSDAACFCTSVGGGPGDTRGSDILLTPVEGGYLAEIFTEKGRSIQNLAPTSFQPSQGLDKASRLASVAVAFDQPALTAKLPGLFDDDIWKEQSLRCVGCGACAYVCPTCVCFDIQEEGDRSKGSRLRCWDSCGFHTFTLHASGHNPREVQSQRWRQRIYHKFAYYPERYDMLGCVGCGKCTRSCPVDMNLQAHLADAAETK